MAFLRDTLSPDESFYLLSDEIKLLLLRGRRCPVWFPLLTMVANDLAYQREIIKDLESHNVKYAGH